MNNTRYGAALAKNANGASVLSKPILFLLSRFAALRAFGSERSYFKRSFGVVGFDALDRTRLDINSENNFFIVNKFCRDYLASFLRIKIFSSRSKLIGSKKNYFSVRSSSLKYQSIFDILFRFNALFTLFLSKSYLPSGKFFFERSFRELTSNLAQLIIIYNFRNLAESSSAYFFNEILSFRLGGFLRKIGVYFTFFSQLKVSKFFKYFFKFLVSAIGRTFSGLDVVTDKVTRSSSSVIKTTLYAYKFKQL